MLMKEEQNNAVGSGEEACATPIDATPWSTLGLLVFLRTYSRPKRNGTQEQFNECVDRVIKATDTQLRCAFTEEEKSRLRHYILALKGTVAGRFLWQLGTPTVDKLGLASLQNCWMVAVDNMEAFCFAFDKLMLGGGVGFSIRREHVKQLPKVRTDFIKPVRRDSKDADFIVPDTREGWIELLRQTLGTALEPSRKPCRTYSTQLVRGKGESIKGFGGISSGAEPLCRGLEQIGEILEGRKGTHLTTVDCLDIMNIIGSIVVSGNVRRSAQIAIGDADDIPFIMAKRWDLGSIPPWRSNSNNSVVCSDISELPDEFWEGYQGNGECYGLINLELCRKIGRLGDTAYPDPKIIGVNPCAEIALENGEPCCLAEIFLPNVDSLEELLDITKLLYRINKHSLGLPAHDATTQEVVARNLRMGIGVTGYLQATEEQRKWLPKVYSELRLYDKEYSGELNVPESIKLTTQKPSGTLSLLPGVTPGCHPAFATYMIRRIRISSDSPLVEICRKHGYHIEPVRYFDGSEDKSTSVISFPFSYPEGTPVADELSAIDQLEVVRRVQRDWSDNAVSCTIYYGLEELPAIKKYLKKNYTDNFKSVSFLLRQEHGFDQAPLEKISKEVFDEMVKTTTKITEVNYQVDQFEDAEDCVGGACPIK